MVNTEIRENYSDKMTSEKLWFNKSFTDDFDFQKERFLLHLERGDIKIKFMEVPNKFKKLDEVNICKPFIIYAMRRNGRTPKGKDKFSYNKNLSIFLTNMIVSSMFWVSHSGRKEKSDINTYNYKWIAEKNNMLEEWEFLKAEIKKTGKVWSEYLTKKNTFKEIEAAWQHRGKDTTEGATFKLNHKFALWYALFDQEIITTDTIKEFLLNKNGWQTNKFETTKIYPEDDFRVRVHKTIQRERIIKMAITDPIYFTCVSREDMEDKDFAMKVLTAFNTLTQYRSSNGNECDHQYSPIYLSLFPLPVRDNEEVVLFNYTITGSLSFASRRLKNDRHFILENGLNDIGGFSDELKNDFDFIKTLITTHEISDYDLSNVGEQLKNDLDYIEWLLEYRYDSVTQESLEDGSDSLPIGIEIIKQCRDEYHRFSLDLLKDLLEKNRFNKKLAVDLNRGKNDAPVKKLKI
ncbi:hypothetical protein [Burkholderia multivorans]|uniref:hypothetical protein n=1 Tax=Burkholderia multivorans TaxID=87883 RepID=UPI0011B1DACF|nr:hypothetical protein [Burkholderia multivorans]